MRQLYNGATTPYISPLPFVTFLPIFLTNIRPATKFLPKSETNGDGITVEVCSYYKNLDHAQAWEWIKASTVTTYEKTTIKGQITSAFFTKEDDPLSKIIISYTKDDYDSEFPAIEEELE